MTAHAERVLEERLRERVRLRLAGMVVKLAPTVRGIPDRLILLPDGLMFLVELKAVGGRVSPIQAEWHKRAAALGTVVVVLTGAEEIDAWVQERVDARAGTHMTPDGRPYRPVRRDQP